MEDYARRFGTSHPDGTFTFTPVRQGSIVALLCAGALFGSLIAGKMADQLGRRVGISVSAFSCCIGIIIEISSTTAWHQFAIGRFVNGLGIGSLSVLVPMYQSESSPTIIRGMLVASYQLFITLGIWTAEMINYGTETQHSSSSWRIPNGMSFLWALILGGGILFLPESPRFAYRQGRKEEARNTMGKLAGLAPDSRSVSNQITEIRVKLDEERAGVDTKWYEIFTGPKMFYRTMLGIVLQAGQQLTGANFFFIILGSVNVICTFAGLYVVQRCGRRNALMFGAAWMMMCFLIYAFIGHFLLNTGKSPETGGNVLVVFSCLFIAAFAATWGPLVWAVVAELYPARYRAPCMALATASNWLWNFLISFFTEFIVSDIDYLYGLVFAGCCAGLFLVVFFFVIESKDRSLEEIDTMYVLGVDPITSAKWDGSKLLASADTSSRTLSQVERGATAQRVPTRTVEE
ncbi:hypothetical protein LTR28_006797 [Elasticomyces elasticus]|nr:hypothetical protein LTR28_006797 [Elasticomyces elasticus]